MKKILCLLLFLFLVGCSANREESWSRHQISPGDVFDPGAYIDFEGLEITYDGDLFHVANNRDDIVRVSVMVVGVKKDGSYDAFQWPAFCGPDETQYQKDLEENGWAVKYPTNMVRPGETLAATLSIFDPGDDYHKPDIDGDGYYDIVFSVHPQPDEDSSRVSTDDPVSDVYKLTAD